MDFIGRFDELDKYIVDLNQYLSFDGCKVIRNGITTKITTPDEDITLNTNSAITEGEFLKKKFKEVSISASKLDGTTTDILGQRLEEHSATHYETFEIIFTPTNKQANN